MIKLDAGDRNILAALQRNARISNVELAKVVHMSESACLRRTKALEQAGIIQSYRAILDNKRAGYAVSAYVIVQLDQRAETDAQQFFDAVQKEPRVVECVLVTGTPDVILKVVAQDMDDFAELTLSGILRLPSVRDVSSSLVLKVLKQEYGLPMRDPAERRRARLKR